MSEQPQDPDRSQNDGQVPYPPQQPQPPYPPQQPGQPYAQPGQPYTQPAQPYAQPGQPYAVAVPPSAPGQTTAPRSGGLGRTALVVAASAVAIGLLWQLVTPFMYASVGFGVVEFLSNLLNLVVMAGAGAGLVLGVIALRRPAPHLLAAIAIGVGGSTVIGTLVAWASNVFFYLGF